MSTKPRIGLCIQAMGGSYQLGPKDPLNLLEKFLPRNLNELEVKGLDPVYLVVQANDLEQLKFWHKIGMPLNKIYPGDITLVSLAERYGFKEVGKYLAIALKSSPSNTNSPRIDY